MRPTQAFQPHRVLFVAVAAVAGAAIVAGSAFGQTTNLTYENWAEGFFTQACTSCHHSSQTGLYRFGAPRGVNFDTLESIRAQEADIRLAVLGEDRYMPPMGITWDWDRANLLEWLDAGMPGGAGALEPVATDDNEKTLYYQQGELYFSQPIRVENDVYDFNSRYIRIERMSEMDVEVPQEYCVYINKRDDGTIVMTRREWKSEETGVRRLDYSPGVPILVNGGDPSSPDWFASVQVREQVWIAGKTWSTPDSETIQAEQWVVKTESVETLDNGVILPIDGLKVVQSNLTTGTDFSWWYAKGYGPVRIEESFASSSPDLERESHTYLNILRGDRDPLRSPPLIESASTEWLPFVGSDYDPNNPDRQQRYRMDYWYQLDVQGKGVVDTLAQAQATATPTLPPLDPDPEDPPVPPTPTATPIWMNPSGPPSGGGNPGAYEVTDPRVSNMMDDEMIDSKDLLIFLQHWHKPVQ